MWYKLFLKLHSIRGDHNWLIDNQYVYVNNNSEKLLYIYDAMMQIMDYVPFARCSGIRKVGNQFYTELKTDGIYLFSRVLIDYKSIEPCIYMGKNYGIVNPVVGNTCLGFFQKEAENYVGIWDLKLNTFIWENTIDIASNKALTEHLFIYQNKKYKQDLSTLTALDRLIGNLIWERDLSALGGEGAPWQIGRIIGVFEQVVAVMIRWETMEQLVGLDVNTGQVRWHLNNTHDPQTGEVVFPNIVPCLGQMQPSVDGRRLYGLRYNVFIEIEPATGNILRLRRFGPANSLHFTHEGKEISIKNTRLHEGYFYFTATLQGETFSSGLLGAFDIESEQIVWLHDMGFTRGGQFFNEGAAPVLDGNRLYVLDHEGTLHIFEKE